MTPPERDTKVRVFLDRQALTKRVDELARSIDGDSAGQPLVAISILQGSFFFFADLVRRLETPLNCEFLAVARYRGGTSQSGEVKLVLDIEETLERKHLLPVDDLVETGLTLEFIKRLLSARNPASLRTCSLFRRRTKTTESPTVEYVGFELKNEFVVGYGIDHEGRYRALPYVGIIEGKI